ncbi:WD domain-containing protein [Xylogone sp. PMI_703]|nr:WD domain-containing protein [Xylogone sp. PMI_703]
MRPDSAGSGSNGTARPFSNGSTTTAFPKTALPGSPNGTRKSPIATNGSLSTNGHSGSKPRPSYFGHDREEVTRILIQALSDLGYNGAAGTLSRESGYDLESPTVAAFRNAVLQGEWNEAEDLLFGSSGSAGQDTIGTSGTGLVLQDGVDKNVMRFWLRQQKFLELLEERDTGRALMVLRSELTPLYQDTSKLHFLSSLLMCPSAEDLKQRANWDGAYGESRHHLLSQLSKFISPSVMLPEHRLAVLLHQVKRNQIANCLYHNTATSPSLYQDHICDRNNFPLHTILELTKHIGEVWQVQFSHDGRRLATGGADGNVIIYNVPSFEEFAVLSDHHGGICCIAWSPDDTMIVTCAQDKRAVLWDVNDKNAIRSISRFGEPVSSCVWAPDGQSFVTGCLDKERNLLQWNLNGETMYDWLRVHRIQDLAVSPDGNRLVAMDCEHHIHVYNFVTRELEYEIDFKVRLTSVSISQDSRYLLINNIEGETQMLDLETRDTVRTFISGEKGGNFMIRSAFGGANESFVITGSEEGGIFIYHKENGTLVEKLEGHKGTCCNSVSWNPVNPSMFASAGDDGKVKIWASQGAILPVTEAANDPVNPREQVNHW